VAEVFASPIASIPSLFVGLIIYGGTYRGPSNP
jgi:hypothetical protein